MKLKPYYTAKQVKWSKKYCHTKPGTIRGQKFTMDLQDIAAGITHIVKQTSKDTQTYTNTNLNLQRDEIVATAFENWRKDKLKAKLLKKADREGWVTEQLSPGWWEAHTVNSYSHRTRAYGDSEVDALIELNARIG